MRKLNSKSVIIYNDIKWYFIQYDPIDENFIKIGNGLGYTEWVHIDSIKLEPKYPNLKFILSTTFLIGLMLFMLYIITFKIIKKVEKQQKEIPIENVSENVATKSFDHTFVIDITYTNGDSTNLTYLLTTNVYNNVDIKIKIIGGKSVMVLDLCGNEEIIASDVRMINVKEHKIKTK